MGDKLIRVLGTTAMVLWMRDGCRIGGEGGGRDFGGINVGGGIEVDVGARNSCPLRWTVNVYRDGSAQSGAALAFPCKWHEQA